MTPFVTTPVMVLDVKHPSPNFAHCNDPFTGAVGRHTKDVMTVFPAPACLCRVLEVLREAVPFEGVMLAKGFLLSGDD